MLQTSLLLSVLSATLGVESPVKSMEKIAPYKTRNSLLVTAEKLTDEQQIEAEARRIVGHSLADNC
jgi:hypothetical protein